MLISTLVFTLQIHLHLIVDLQGVRAIRPHVVVFSKAISFSSIAYCHKGPEISSQYVRGSGQ